jgi:hypothetical protein
MVVRSAFTFRRGVHVHRAAVTCIVIRDNKDYQSAQFAPIAQGSLPILQVNGTRCPDPSCQQLILDLLHLLPGAAGHYLRFQKRLSPELPTPPALPESIPEAFRETFIEAYRAQTVSPSASAILLRKIVEHVLMDHGFNEKDLKQSIEKALEKGGLSVGLANALHDLREVGNWGAHPKPLPLIVEESEVDALFSAVEQAFEHFYVAPAEAKARRDRINVKRAAANKPSLDDEVAKTRKPPAA